MILPDDRGARGSGYTLLTPANRYVSRLPSLAGASFFKLATPRLAPARFGQYLVHVGDTPVDVMLEPAYEHFLFVLEGQSAVAVSGLTHELGFGYVPAAPEGGPARWIAAPDAQVLWIKRPYEPWPGLAAPAPVLGNLAAVAATPTAVPGLNRRELLDPTDPAFDFNMSHMEFDADVALAQIEIHDEEHGLFMTSGGGLYHLGGDEHPVAAGDFIYMAPYCPQGFQAGREGGSYLLYKDVYRDGF